MSDEHLRELERRWKETGTVEDEAAWLKERVRVGDLTQERLELAAYLGHEAAQDITESMGWSPSASTFPTTGVELLLRRSDLDLTQKELAELLGVKVARVGKAERAESEPLAGPLLASLPRLLRNPAFWLEGIGGWGSLAVVRAGVAAGHLASPGPFAALRRVEDWILCPCDDHEALAWEAADACWSSGRMSVPLFAPDVNYARSWLGQAMHKHPGEQVCGVVRAELAPWALGYSDPVRDRVEARKACAGD